MSNCIIRILILVFIGIHANLALASDKDSIKVIVLDENDSRVGSVKVSIEGLPTFTCKNDGTWQLPANPKPVFPLTASIVKKGYEIDELNFYNAENEIEVRIRKVVKTESKVRATFYSADNKILNGISVTYSNKVYRTDHKGIIDFPFNTLDSKLLMVKGYSVSQIKRDANLSYTVSLELPKEKTPSSEVKIKEPIHAVTASVKDEMQRAQSSDKTVMTGSSNTIDEQSQLENPNASEAIFKQYQQEFENLNKEVVRERERILESNQKIREEIEKAILRLKTEKNLTKAQREKLIESIDKLENELIENTIAYNKADEKTMHLVNNLKMMVLQKDSINAVTLKKLKIEQKKVVVAERKTKRTIIIFTIISISLVLLAVVFYSIARKMRKQRTLLLKANEELKSLKKELANSVNM